MSDPYKELVERAGRYVIARQIELKHELGRGKDGTVFSTNIGTAVKVFTRSDALEREVACYLRLRERGIRDIMGHFVPKLVDVDRALRIIELTMVKQPFLLDFASAYLDYPPDFSPEVLEQWEEDKSEQFGKNWSRVKVLMEVLQNQCDIYLFDVHPGNITFAQ